MLKRRHSFTLLTFAIFALVLLVSAEITGKILLRRRADPYGLFFQPATTSASSRAVFFPLLDPLLGWGRQPPFYVYQGGPGQHPEEPLSVGHKPAGVKRVFGLGGSTTDAEIERENWVFQLAKECTSHSVSCEAANGGISGYSSTQELLKLERDVLPLMPDLVISLNGVNDEAFRAFDGRTFVNNHQVAINKALRVSEWDAQGPLAEPPPLVGAFPHARFLLQVMAFFLKPAAMDETPIGVEDRFSSSKRWETNVRMMHALGKEFGFRYFVFLQPHLGLEPAAAKAKLAEMGIHYLYDEQHLNQFYDEAGAICRRLDYCADLSHDFIGKGTFFKDMMHLNSEGHAIEAAKMFQVLRAHGAL